MIQSDNWSKVTIWFKVAIFQQVLRLDETKGSSRFLALVRQKPHLLIYVFCLSKQVLKKNTPNNNSLKISQHYTISSFLRLLCRPRSNRNYSALECICTQGTVESHRLIHSVSVSSCKGWIIRGLDMQYNIAKRLSFFPRLIFLLVQPRCFTNRWPRFFGLEGPHSHPEQLSFTGPTRSARPFASLITTLLYIWVRRVLVSMVVKSGKHLDFIF